MKTIIALALVLTSVSAFAGMPWVRNNGNSVTLDYWNNSDRDERCSGPIYLTFEDNSRDTIQVYEFVWKRGSLYRTYYPNQFGKRITNASSSVWCF